MENKTLTPTHYRAIAHVVSQGYHDHPGLSKLAHKKYLLDGLTIEAGLRHDTVCFYFNAPDHSTHMRMEKVDA